MAGLVMTFAAVAQTPQPATRFDITGYAVEGAPLLRSEDFSRIVSPFIGRQKTAADVQKARQSLQQAYLDLGHCSVQVTVPKTEPDAGVITFRLVQTPVPLSKDCLPMVVLDEKRTTPPVPVAPGEVAVRPLADVTATAPETPVPVPTKPEIARAPLKPLQDRPLAAAPAAPAPPATKPAITVAPAPREEPVAGVSAKPLAEAPVQPGLIVTPAAPAPAPVAVAPSAPPPVPKPEVALAPASKPAPAPLPAPKEEPPPAPVAVAPQPPVAPKVEVEPPKPAPIIAVAPKPEPVPTPQPAPKVEPPVAVAPAPAPKVEPAPVIAVAPVQEEKKPESPPVVATPEPAPQPAPKVEPPVAAAPAPAPKVEPAPVIAVAPVQEEKKPEPPPVVATPEPAPQPAPKVEPPVAVAPAPAPKVEPAPVAAAAEPKLLPIEPAKPEAAPAPAAVAVAPIQVEPQPAPKVEPPPVAVAPVPAPKVEPAPPALVADKEPAASAPAEPAAAVAPGAVEVRPFADVIATAPAPSTPAEPKPEIERAPVRPLQDRPPAAKPAIAAAPAPAGKPEAAPAPRVPEAAAEKKPAPKPAPVIVQAPAAPAEPAAAAESAAEAAPLKFDIERYLVEGNTLLKPEAIGKALQRYIGKQKDFADVQRALEALQIAYQNVGYGAVQVTLPEQELERGEVRFEVIEIRIGKVEVQGNEYYSESNIRRSVPALKEGETPDSHAIARSLKVANENPTKQTQMSMKAGSKDGEVDATIKVVDTSPRKYSVSFDNTGTATTGQFRLGFGFQHSNLFDRDHSLTLQYITNPEHVNKVTVVGAGYHVPLYGRGDSVDFILGYSDVDSGTVQNLFNVSGAGLIMLGRYNQTLDRIEEYEHKLTYGIDYKAFQSRVTTLSGTPLVPDITLHPVSVAYSGVWRKPASDLSFYASLWYNPLPGGNDAAQSDFAAARGGAGGASAEYVIWRYGGVYTRLLPDDWTLRVALNGQTTRNALLAPEQFGLGGANSVRGFNERAYSNDKGHQAQFEIYTPDLAGKFGFPGGRLKLMAFYDTGTLGRNFLQPGEQTGLSVDSIGLGLRLSAHDRINLRLDYAQVLHDGGVDAGLRDGRRNANTLHASLVWVY